MKTFFSITVVTLFTQTLLSVDMDYDQPNDESLTFGGLDTASYDFSNYNSDNCANTTTTAAPANPNGNAAGTGTGTGAAPSWSKYAGDGGYDNGNDNGSGKQQRVLCDCTKKASKSKTDDNKSDDNKDSDKHNSKHSSNHGGSFDNDAFSKCVNEEFGNNAWTWDHKYINKYKNGYSTTIESAATDTLAAGLDDDDSDDSDDSDDFEALYSTTPMAMDDNTGDEKSGLISQHANFQENSDLDDGTNSGDNNGNNSSQSVTHSDYMSYLAIFILFLGAVLLIAVGIHCFKYIWKSYRLRNYEAIGETAKQTQEKQAKKQKRIRLPRRNGNTIKDDNEVYTIGNV